MSLKSVIHLLLDQRRDAGAIFVPSFVFYLIITKLFKTWVFHVSVGALHDFGHKGTAYGKLFKTIPQAFFVKLPKSLLKLFSSACVQHCFAYLFLVLRADSQLVSVSLDVTGAHIYDLLWLCHIEIHVDKMWNSGSFSLALSCSQQCAELCWWITDLSKPLQCVLTLPLCSQNLKVVSARTAFEKCKTLNLV